MWNWLRKIPISHAPSPVMPVDNWGKPHSHCDDCEFSFFNHDATLPFDQWDECHCASHQRKQHAHDEA